MSDQETNMGPSQKMPVPFPIDIIVRTPEELQHRLDIGDYFIQDILDRGRAIYKRKQVSR
jgi:hypothetical protein